MTCYSHDAATSGCSPEPPIAPRSRGWRSKVQQTQLRAADPNVLRQIPPADGGGNTMSKNCLMVCAGF